MTTERERFLPTGQGEQAPNAGRVLALLFAANTFNFYDRAVPAIVAEPVKLEFGLSDLQIGILAAVLPLSILAGEWLHRRINPERFKTAINLLLVFCGLVLLVR